MKKLALLHLIQHWQISNGVDAINALSVCQQLEMLILLYCSCFSQADKDACIDGRMADGDVTGQCSTVITTVN
jgi:hypothetical protein